MADILPTVLFPNMTSDATGITIPYTDIPAVTQAEADVASGDGREVARGLTEAIVSTVGALDAVTAPAEMLVSKNTSPTTGSNTIRDSYSLSFDVVVDPTAVSMAPEA